MTVATGESFETFDVSVLWPDQHVDPWVSVASELGTVHAVKQVGFGDRLRPYARNDAWWFQSAIMRGTPVGPRAKTFGDTLRQLVFGSERIAQLYHSTKGAAHAKGRVLLVRLLVAPETLAALPWEFMLDPENRDDFLVLRPDTILARSPRSRAHPLRLAPVTPPLNMLLVLSNPKPVLSDPKPSGLHLRSEIPFDHYEEGRALLRELSPLISAGLLQVDVVNRPTIENLRRRMGSRDRGYHIVHFLGHASADQLKLEEGGRAKWQESSHFTSLLGQCKDLRLTFYAGCRTSSLPARRPQDADTGNGPQREVGRPTAEPFPTSVADRTLQDACQNVIGMQSVLPFQTERVLTRFFYQAICTGATIGGALSAARAAVRDDTTLGPELANWAVPTLATSSTPGTILAADASPIVTPRRLRQRAQLKLDAVEHDREFFARFAQLQDVVAVLRREDPHRVVWITGPPQSGQSRLLDRALDEAGPEVDILLYCRATRLVAAERDPVEQLARLVTELVRRSGRTPVDRDPEWDPDEWWGRIIESISDVPAVLAIDDIDKLSVSHLERLGEALWRIVARRSSVRLALCGGDTVRRELLWSSLNRLVTQVHVPHHTMDEVLGWVRRNRPSLGGMIAQMPEDERGWLYRRLGSDLQRWSDLAAAFQEQTVKNLDRALAVVLPPESSGSGKPPAGVPLVALVGPFEPANSALLADTITSLAQTKGVGGRVVLSDNTDPQGVIAQLEAAPVVAGEDALTWSPTRLEWLRGLPARNPDIAVLVGAPPPGDVATEIVGQLAAKETLMIVADVDPAHDEPAWPAPPGQPGHPAITVGAMNKSTKPVRGSDYTSHLPQLFATGSVDIPLSRTAGLPATDVRVTTLAALNTLATAILVMSANPGLTPREVGRLLVTTSQPIKTIPGGSALQEVNAVRNVRARAVLAALADGPRNAHAIAAATGMDIAMIEGILEQLEKMRRVRRYEKDYVATPGW